MSSQFEVLVAEFKEEFAAYPRIDHVLAIYLKRIKVLEAKLEVLEKREAQSDSSIS
jgi:hypothetical protein